MMRMRNGWVQTKQFPTRSAATMEHDVHETATENGQDMVLHEQYERPVDRTIYMN